MGSLYPVSFHFAEIIPRLSWVNFISPIKHCPDHKQVSSTKEMELFSYLRASVVCGFLPFQQLMDIKRNLYLVTLPCGLRHYHEFSPISVQCQLLIYFLKSIWNKRFQEINILTGLTPMIFFPAKTTHRNKNSAWNNQREISHETCHLKKELRL